ncbi:hypothetical protein ABIB25_001673 [Nakamurella sp. UYEF19]|uniref:methyltransferase n=1 Tax=Nakamurella sp. UYEF19 TaxID=1756392 RepID=UPI0033907E5B
MTAPNPATTLLEAADLLRPHAIRTAAALELADHIEAGATTTHDLVVATGADPAMLAKLLNYLELRGVLSRSADQWSVTEAGAPLHRSHPQSVGQYLSAEGLFGRMELGLAGLLQSVRTGGSCYRAAFGSDYWQDVNGDPRYLAAIQREGAVRPGWGADLVIHGYDWTTAHHVTDIGGNNGTLLISLLQAHSHLSGRVLDLANLAETADKAIAAAGLADRAEAVTGDFFAPLPSGSDVYLLSAILADWADGDAIRLLSRCADAAGPTGIVLLAEVSLPALDPTTDLLLSASLPAPSRTEDQLLALAAAAGLQLHHKGPSDPVRSVLAFRGRS